MSIAQVAVMSDYEPILNALSTDLAAVCLGFMVFGVLYFIPSMVVAFIAATVSRPNSWSELPRGSVWGWLIGVIAWVSTTALLILLAEMLLGSRMSGFRIELFVGFMFIGFLVAVSAQYHFDTHFYLSQGQDRVGWETEPRFRPVKRYFTFTLKSLLIAQIVLIFLFGLWVGARRSSILREYELRRIKKLEEQQAEIALPGR
jgi:hypothetical protein